ncbi:uncharacterized protein METZ01_LOCUS19822 [marine metagenome]|uniref:Tetratricopeptide repeat-like domain-containing protein n=1 Tax=marine metagenome TaxID=408172 RepID=A0A381PKK0_9ZZZZ
MNKFIYTILLAFLFFSCSTKKNKPLNKGYHAMVSSYNVLFNGAVSIEEGLLQTQNAFNENFWEVLPIEKIKISDEIITVDGIDNANFIKGEEKAAKTIQKHSMIINGIQENSKIANAYLLLGKARYLDQRFVPALDAFNQVYKHMAINDELDESIIWKAKCNIRLEQEGSAIDLLKNLLIKEKINSRNKAHANAVLSMAYLQLDELEKSSKALKIASEIETNKITKARHLYILGQLLEKQLKIDSANIYFRKVAEFKRKIPRELYINARLKNLLYDSLEIKNKEAKIIKMIENYENEDFLDKIYYSYSMLLFSNGSKTEGIKFLNKAMQEKSSDNELLSRSYRKLSDIYFKDSKYLMAGKYLDSTMSNLDKKSKKFWEAQRQKKGLSQIIELENKVSLYDSLIRISLYDDEKLKNILGQIKISEKKLKEERYGDKSSPPVSRRQQYSSRKNNFYFYDDNLVELGKSSFLSIWGKRTRNSYWRSSNSFVASSTMEEENVEEKASIIEEPKTIDNNELLSLIPTTVAQKDSIILLKNKSLIKLSEIYLVKYKDYSLAEKRLQNLLHSKPNKEIVAEANYLLFKLFSNTNKNRADQIKKRIIADFPKTKFAKILTSSNRLVMEEEALIAVLDSLQKLFENQKFEQTIEGVATELVFIENKELAVDYELLKASSIGRLEGILRYDEELKKIITNYPNSKRIKEIQNINKEINRKWKKKTHNTTKGEYFLIFSFKKEELNKEILSKIKSLTNSLRRVSMDVYDYKTALIVIKDFKNKKSANFTRDFLKENADSLRLKNNFVVLSSQYKNMLIYKTLDLYKE